MTKTYSDIQLIEAVAQNKSIAGVLRQLNLKPAGGNYKTVHSEIVRLKLDSSHFNKDGGGQGWRKGSSIPVRSRMPLVEILIVNSPYKSSSNLRQRLINENIFKPICSSCRLEEWLDKPIPLELEHINGNSSDNSIDNLCLLCPNCHALTSTYRGKNIKRK